MCENKILTQKKKEKKDTVKVYADERRNSLAADSMTSGATVLSYVQPQIVVFFSLQITPNSAKTLSVLYTFYLYLSFLHSYSIYN